MHVRGKFCVDLTIAHVVRAARTAFRERRARDDKRGVRVLELILNADGVVEDGHVRTHVVLSALVVGLFTVIWLPAYPIADQNPAVK